MGFKLGQKIIDKIRGKKQQVVQNENIQNIISYKEDCQCILNELRILNNLIRYNPQKTYSGGQKWELELQRRYENKMYLDGFGYKVFSQNDEDGIINEIFNRIGTTNKKFIEFGVQNGFECNSYLLLLTGWQGLWIDGNPNDCEQIRSTFKTSLERNLLQLENSFITKDNINSLFEKNNFSGEIDFLSVDIDGNDWYILKSILEAKQINPRVICVEYNPLIPPSADPDDYSTDWIMDYKEDWVWKYDDCQGASLSAYYHLCRDYGYKLVGTCVNGVNAFFVREDLIQNNFVPDTQGALTYYNPWRHKVVKYLKPFADGVCALNEALDNRLAIYDKVFHN